MGIGKWSQTASENTNARSGINWDEGMAPSAVNDSARSTLAAVREWYDDAEWIKLGENGSANAFSISYVSATVFKFTSTDRRTLVPVGRRVKAGVGAGLIYGTVSDVTLSASDTQVTVSFDSGSLDSSLSYVSLGILSSSNNSFPRGLNASFSDVTVTGRLIGTTGTISSAVSATGTSFTVSAAIPTWASRITLLFNGLSTNGTDSYLVQIGPSGGVESTGYVSESGLVTTATSNVTSSTAGFVVFVNNASFVVSGKMEIDLTGTANTWVANGICRNSTVSTNYSAGIKTISGQLECVSVTTTGGTNTFDAGSVTVKVE